MDPRVHQRDVGERERYPPQAPPAARGGVRRGSPEQRRAQAKADKNTKDRHEQTAHARVAAHRTLAAGAARSREAAEAGEPGPRAK